MQDDESFMFQSAENFANEGGLVKPNRESGSEAGVLLQQVDGTIQSCDRRAEELLGYSVKQLVAANQDATSDSAATFLKLRDVPKAVLQSSQLSHQQVIEFDKSNGDRIWLRLDSTPLFQPDDPAPNVVVTRLSQVPSSSLLPSPDQPPLTSHPQTLPLVEQTTDAFLNVTQRKQVEEALRISEARFRLLIDSAKDYAIFTLDLEGRITQWNSGAQRLLGYSEAEIVGQLGRIIFTPEDRDRQRPENEMHIALTQERAENERWHVRKDGSCFWGSGFMMPLQNEAGNPQGFVKILQDKTAQRLADERFQLLYDTTSDLLATNEPLALMHNLFVKLSAQLDLHCYYNYMVEEKDNQPMLCLRNCEGISEEVAQSIEWIELGQYLCGLVAQTRQQIVFDHLQMATHPNAQLLCSMGVTAYSGQPLIVQGRLLGTLSFASCTRTRFTQGEINLMQSTCDQMAIAIDRANLTKSIQQQAEQLQRANQIKDEFLAVLSHELRSPLNPILGWTKMLQSGRLDATKTTQALETIERNARLQTELIEDLLDVSRILQGKLSLSIRPVDLALTIEAAIETVSLSAAAKSISIHTQLDARLGLVSGDSSRLQQIVWNLVSNAVKFTPEGGHVDVRLERVEPEARGEEKGSNALPRHTYAQITVKDTGKGINPAFLPYVFDYFRQEDGNTTRKFGGLGLGLAIVRYLTELHGGTVSADSPGDRQGATFTVRLPLSTVEVKPDPEPQETLLMSQNSLRQVRVLLVDDVADMRDVVTFALEQAGAEVMAVSSAAEALTALVKFRPTILLSDIGMPDMDGYMLLRQVRSLFVNQNETEASVLEAVRSVPAIALTAYAAEFDQQQALQAGFQRHLAKPVEPEALVREILDLLRTHQSR